MQVLSEDEAVSADVVGRDILFLIESRDAPQVERRATRVWSSTGKFYEAADLFEFGLGRLMLRHF